MDPLFQRELFLEREGVVTKIVATVHGFTSCGNGDYACTISLDEVEARPIEIFQVDQLGSLLQALTFLDRRIRDLEKKGWLIWWLEKGDRGRFNPWHTHPEPPAAQ
ncbi:hypothetical protein SAMN05444156_2944 [Verrucomicrobium sp. GAS474]|uniref:hypothetical protein n=1 Tax=Verrucomicrobium sp. GAS474 TaxID=1882831 RepID=UPI00087C4BAB|nr:hypothetical protein [Verrucomicrobium sp. GAS474]SDU26498.1 hypothetical protein SAMN05444156_2944 [Verrucomicrobium sp. GAS474]